MSYVFPKRELKDTDVVDPEGLNSDVMPAVAYDSDTDGVSIAFAPITTAISQSPWWRISCSTAHIRGSGTTLCERA